MFQDSLTSNQKRLNHDKVPVQSLESSGSDSNSSSNSSSSPRSHIRQDVNVNSDSSDSDDQITDETEIQPNSEISYQKDHTQNSLESDPNSDRSRDSSTSLYVNYSPSGYSLSADRQSDQSLTVPIIPINTDQPSNQPESSSDYRIISFHSIGGNFESFGTSIFFNDERQS